MNNTTTAKRNVALAAVLMAAILVVGTIATTTTTIGTTQTALAYSQKKKDNGKGGNDNGNTITIQKCKQAATQSGFDNNQGQECENVICTHPGENATCVQENVIAPTPVTPVKKTTCEQCFSSLNQVVISELLSTFDVTTLAQLCTLFEGGTVSEERFIEVLTNAGVSERLQIELIACLRDAGIVFRIE
jgi:hypothetical protein